MLVWGLHASKLHKEPCSFVTSAQTGSGSPENPAHHIHAKLLCSVYTSPSIAPHSVVFASFQKTLHCIHYFPKDLQYLFLTT